MRARLSPSKTFSRRVTLTSDVGVYQLTAAAASTSVARIAIGASKYAFGRKPCASKVWAPSGEHGPFECADGSTDAIQTSDGAFAEQAAEQSCPLSLFDRVITP
jgi:hypothetical protein